MTRFEHSKKLSERMQYKAFLKLAMDRIEADIARMKSFELSFIRKPWTDGSNAEFVKYDNLITEIIDNNQKQENEYMLPHQERYLKILKDKHAQYQTHFQHPIYKCLTCHETECVCNSVFPKEKVFVDRVNKLF